MKDEHIYPPGSALLNPLLGSHATVPELKSQDFDLQTEPLCPSRLGRGQKARHSTG